MAFSDAEFFEQGLNFPAEEALKLSRMTKLVCLAMGGAMGAALAISTMGNTSGAQAPGNIKLYSALAGLFAGAAIGAGSCTVIRSKIIKFIDSVRHLPLANAIAKMKAGQREELRSEARKLLAMQDRILQLEQESKSPSSLRSEWAT